MYWLVAQDKEMKGIADTEVAIIGAGINGLTCAAYLARAGFKVVVFEKNAQVGGLCVNEKPFAGSDISVSSVASYFGMLRPEIAQDLGLEELGMEPYLTDPVEIVLLPNGEYVSYPREGSAAMNVHAMTEADKTGWLEFWGDIQKAAAIVNPRYLKPISAEEYLELLQKAGLDKIAKTIFTGSLLDLASMYFSADSFKAVAATCTPGFANMPGSVFGCIHHGTASTLGIFGAWGQVKGGMGKVTEAVAQACKNYGAKIMTNTPVKQLHISGERVQTLETMDGQKHKFDLVICASDLHTLFEKLIEPEYVPSGIQAYLKANLPKVSAAKLHYLLKKLPDLTTLKSIGHNHKGVLVIAPKLDAVINASATVPKGLIPQDLMLTMAFPTLEDALVYGAEADMNKQVLTVDVHYLPAYLQDADNEHKLREWTQKDDAQLSATVIDIVNQYAPGFSELIIDSYVVSPNKLKAHFNNLSLSCWHMPMTQDFSFESRTLPTYPHYHTPYENLYICGAGTYPGGNVTGANGHNLARLLQNAYSLQAQPA